MVVEVALALVLLTAAGMLLSAFERLRGRDLGFQPQGVLTMQPDCAPRSD